MVFKKTLALVSAALLSVGLVSCSSSGDNAGGTDSGSNYVLANGSEPQNPLIPSNTNETGGGRIVQMIYSGLMYYDANGKAENDMAESVTLEGEKTYTIKIKPDQKFSDGTQVKAENFVKAWNRGMQDANISSSFFEPILGYEEGKAEMEGLKVVDDLTFTVELTQPESDFPLRLGYSAFYPLPDSAFEDMDAQGEMPVSNGPYKVKEWQHNNFITLVPNENYTGPRTVQNDGLTLTFYATMDAGYADLLAGNLDVLDSVPEAAFGTYDTELEGRSVNQPAAIFQSFTIPERLPHFGGEEGNLRRQALSMAIDREQITSTIFEGTRTPATDFTSPVIDGQSDTVPGSEVLTYNPEKAKELWAQADEISPWEGEFAIAYNSDGGHQGWVDATVNSIKNVLGIEAVGAPYPDFKSLRDLVTNETITTAFRTGWQADYPGLGNFLVPLYTTDASSNDGKYSSPEFDNLMKQAAAAKSNEESITLYNQGQEVLFRDLPAIPLWYSNVVGGYSPNVDSVTFGWDSQPLYYQITKG
ncbi:MAG: ABC transporter substrate-binding protein [Corynebacterium sp.]|nr:ABC transporter substrate-binding protein [Corynebacterium sp.]